MMNDVTLIGSTVLALSVILGLFLQVTKPVLGLKECITELSCSIKELNTNMVKQEKRLEQHAEKINQHERRITLLEYDKNI